MVAVSGNTGSAPLFGSKPIWDSATDESVWSEKGPRPPTPNQTQPASGPWRTGRPME